MFSNGMLTVTGDAANDDVRIIEKGNQVTVRSEEQSQTFHGVQSLMIDLGGGDDRLALVLSGKTGVTPTINVVAGNGNDEVAVDLHHLRTSSSINLTVDMGAGDDQFRLHADDLASQAKLNLNFLAGAGNDQVEVSIGQIGRGASANLMLNLGDGDDTLDAHIGEVVRNAHLQMAVDGGAGDDTARFHVPAANAADVTVVNVEHVSGLANREEMNEPKDADEMVEVENPVEHHDQEGAHHHQEDGHDLHDGGHND
jgi:hypothetical protein